MYWNERDHPVATSMPTIPGGDLAVDTPPDFPASSAAAGPTPAPEELTGRKLLALFDRAAARDFADVRLLAGRLGKDVLLARAAQIDAGFDIGDPGQHDRHP